MYTEGTCPDYRWTYDACSPTASQLVAELDSAARPVKVGKDLPQSGAEGNLVRLPPSKQGVYQKPALVPDQGSLHHLHLLLSTAVHSVSRR